LGWRLDEDVAPAKNVRIVQFTPPGSGCSVTFGNGVTASAPGTAVGALIVSDIKAAHEELTHRGIGASEMWLTDVSLVGFSMGTGEVTRYIGKYGAKRLRKAVLIGTLGPYLVKTADNPEGVDRGVFEGIKAAIRADRPTLLMDFLRNFYNYDVTGGKLVSDRVLEDNWNVAAGASATGTLNCVDAWIEDFRQDIARNTVPTLILHGDADRILPPDASSRRQAKMIKNVRFVELKGGPHGVLWTHAEEVNSELVKFLA
jgi:non-heme chloroperoxidase